MLRPSSAGNVLSLRQVPNSRPRKSGEYEMTPTSCAAHHGRTSCFTAGPQDAVRRLNGVQRHTGRAPLFELRHREVRDADRPDLSRPEERAARGRRFRNRLRRRPVQLIEIDVLDAEPAQAGLALRGHLGRRRRALGSVAVGAETELREDHRPLPTPAAALTARPTTSSE